VAIRTAALAVIKSVFRNSSHYVAFSILRFRR